MADSAFSTFFGKVAAALRKGSVNLEKEGKRKRGHDTRMIVHIYLYENGEKTEFRFITHPTGEKEGTCFDFNLVFHSKKQLFFRATQS